MRLLRHLPLVRTKKHSRRRLGQSLVETALLFPVLLIIFSGLVEVGFWLASYLVVVDAARNAARFSSDGFYQIRDADTNCTTTRDFFRQASCAVLIELAQERPRVLLDATQDDIVVSVVSVVQGTGVTARFPDADGWSYYGNASSRLSQSDINALIDLSAPNTGMVVIEVFYHYHQHLKLPWIQAFLPDPILIYGYAVMPLVSAEPTKTPSP